MCVVSADSLCVSGRLQHIEYLAVSVVEYMYVNISQGEI